MTLALLAFVVSGLAQTFLPPTKGNPPSVRSGESLARLSDTVSVKAQGRGNPRINLSDGHELLTSYVGPEELRTALEQNQAEPLSLASADFDEDGVPDLISGYGYQGRGIVTLLRGNVDSIYPNAPEAKQRKALGTFTDAPFLSPARAFPGPLPADFIGAGDFDGDSHWDVVTASRQSASLSLFSGDGRGGFTPTRQISLPGLVSAMTTGEVNRPDGLSDLIVGTNGPANASVMVFAGPNGALRSQPEVFHLPAPPTTLALGQLDSGYPIDLAIGAGEHLLVVQGRDRKLSLNESEQANVNKAKVSNRKFNAPISSIAVGRFTASAAPNIAIILDNGSVNILSQYQDAGGDSADPGINAWKSKLLGSGAGLRAQLVIVQASGGGHDDLLMVDQGSRRLHMLSRLDSPATGNVSSNSSVLASLDVTDEPLFVLAMRLNSDALTDLAVLSNRMSSPVMLRSQPESTFVVTNTNASGAGSLQFAILDANETPGADNITFNIPGAGPHVITHPVPLPIVTDRVTIDATTQPGYGGTPLVELKSDPGTDGLTISAGNCTVRGLATYGFRHGIELRDNASNSIIEANWIGYDLTGGMPIGVQFNIFTANNTIGGTVPAARNLVTGLRSRDNNGGNIVRGNYFNMTPDGMAGITFALPVSLEGSSGNTIGGTVPGARNVINDVLSIEGTPVFGPAVGNLVQGNYIGTDVNGTASVGNIENGVQLQFQADNNTIGGTVVSARNIVSASAKHGILIGGSVGNLVQGNFIGTDLNGGSDLGSAQNGVIITSTTMGLATSGNTVGGTVAGAGNVISGNNLSGVLIEGAQASGNFVQGNVIGINAAGNAALGNDLNGVSTSQSPGNTIGGPTVAARNILSGNGRHGVSIGIDTQPGSTGVTVQNNFIGTDLTGNNCLGNQRDGVFVNRGSVSHTIVDNLITCNARNGVNIPNFVTNDPGIRIQVTNNSIFANAALGIDLGDAGITSNDIGDADSGANFQQNFPVLTSFGAGAQSADDFSKPKNTAGLDAITVNATLNSTPNTVYTVHWYFSADSQCSTNQASSRPLAAGKLAGVATDANGNASFNFPFDFPAAINSGIINCTATDPQGNTSEFSACLLVSGQGGTPTPTPTPTASTVEFTRNSAVADETAGATTRVDLTVTRSGNTSSPATVDYATSNGSASERSDYLAGFGTLKFAAGDTMKTISVFIVDDRFGEVTETFSVALSSPVGTSMGSPAAVTVIINSDESTNGPNPVRDPNFSSDFFVREHYVDFFNREADSGGLAFWKNQIDECPTQGCREVRRVNVSAAFFVSIEFQQTGYLVYKTYQAAYNSGEFLRLRDFLPDLQEIGRGVVIGQPGADAQLEANKVRFFNDFVQRAKFAEPANYPTTLTAAQFVDKLNANTLDPRNPGPGALTPLQRDALVAQLSPNPASAVLRAQVLRTVSENALFSTRQFNKAFVLMQYFGYLRRNPNDPPESGLDFGGYNFWLTKLNNFNGNYIEAEMVKAFTDSGEYQQRFGP